MRKHSPEQFKAWSAGIGWRPGQVTKVSGAVVTAGPSGLRPVRYVRGRKRLLTRLAKEAGGAS